MFMPENEQQVFTQILHKAYEEFLKERPAQTVKGFVLKILQQLDQENIISEFPELTLELEGIQQRAQETAKKQLPMPEVIVPDERRGNPYSDSVCGETVTEEELAWNPPTYEKDAATKERLIEMFKNNVLMKHLPPSQLSIIAEAAQRVQFPAGAVVIRESDAGNDCYTVDTGVLECVISSMGKVCEYHPGRSFGEVALMYRNQRAATITALTDVVLWKIDRMTYKKIIINASLPQRELFTEFFKTVPILSNFQTDTLHPSVVNELAKETQQLNYAKGSVIMSEGVSKADRYFYVIVKGQVALIEEGLEVNVLTRTKMFGGRVIFLNEIPKVAAIAKNDVHVYRIPEPVVLELDVVESLRKYSEDAML